MKRDESERHTFRAISTTSNGHGCMLPSCCTAAQVPSGACLIWPDFSSPFRIYPASLTLRSSFFWRCSFCSYAFRSRSFYFMSSSFFFDPVFSCLTSSAVRRRFDPTLSKLTPTPFWTT